jgi:hypothetical protein
VEVGTSGQGFMGNSRICWAFPSGGLGSSSFLKLGFSPVLPVPFAPLVRLAHLTFNPLVILPLSSPFLSIIVHIVRIAAE